MAITHFEILELPDSNVVVSQIGASPITIGTLYPIALQNTLNFERHSDLNSFFVKALVKWRVHNQPDEIVGNDSLMELKWIPDNTSLLPSSNNLDQTISNDDVVRLIDVLPINEAAEFIVIENLEGVQNLKSKNNNVYITQKILTTDLIYTEYTAGSEGGGAPYFSLDYQVGQGQNIQPTVYTLSLNIDSLARIDIDNETLINYTDEFDVSSVPTNYNVKEQSFFLIISLGHQNSTANIQVTINSPFLSLNTWNSVTIDNGGVEVQKLANETFNLNVDLDYEGKALLLVKNNIVENTTDPKTGNITVTVIDINGDVNLVSSTDEVVLNTNL